MSPRPIKVAKLPPPPDLSQQDLEQADAEASRWRSAVQDGTTTLERLTGEERRVRVR